MDIVVDTNIIISENQIRAFEIVKNIDKKDLLFVALSIQTGFTLWSGDLKLVNGLRTMGFSNVIETKEIIQRLNLYLFDT
jgi:predicted nucleic acid-binding protein